jgi:hypothetical protein
MTVKQLIYEYLDKNYPIIDGVIKLNILKHEMQYKDIYRTHLTATGVRLETIWTTPIDNEIEEIFGVPINKYLFDWSHNRIGDVVTFKLIDGDRVKRVENCI